MFTTKIPYDIILLELERGVNSTMNQILQTENRKNNGPIEIGKVVKFFAIAIAIFAIILIALGAYYLIKNKQNSNPVEQIPVNTEPNVNITKQEDNILIEVTHNVGITKIVYNWNDEEELTIDAKNNTNLSEKIDLPFGTNTLNLAVIDINGKETKFQKEYVVDGDGKPVISLTLTKDYKIKITVQDATGMQFINYSWNDGDKTKVDANTENPNLIEQVIEIPLGQNTLKVEALNTANVASTKELEVKGVKRPTLSFKKEGDNIIIKAEDEVRN